jgi:diguanylate cyclase (GGDEF)-like protein
MSRPVILCVDDERIILSSLKAQLINNLPPDYRIELAESAEEALEIVAELMQQKIELPVVIADQIMAGMKGDELLAKVKEILPQTLTIMLTGQATADAVGKAVNKAGLFRYLSKPWDEDDLILTVQSALDTYSHQKKLIRQTHYQSVLNQILLLALQPIVFAEQIQEALQKLVAVPCFSPPSAGVIYFKADSHFFDEDRPDELQAESPTLPRHHFRKLAAIGSNLTFSKDIWLNDAVKDISLRYVSGNAHAALQVPSVPSLPAKAHYLCPITADDQLIGLMAVYLSSKHIHTEQIESFLSSFCHSLSGMFRLSASNYALCQSNQALEQHKHALEVQVKNRTEELHTSLQQLEEKNQQLIQANKELAYYATTDSLTGLANRRSFFQQANQSMAQLNDLGKPAVIAMLDLDFFKHINDENGHQAGDTVLQEIAKTLTVSLDDTFIIGRVGGEEFAIFMPDTTQTRAHETCQILIQNIAATRITIASGEISITGSIGVSTVLKNERCIEKAVNRADHALYESKHKGRNTLCMYSAASDNHGSPAC